MPAAMARRVTRSSASQAIGGNSEFLVQIEGPTATGQLDDIRDIVDGLKRGLSVLALHQARDVLVEHGAAEARQEWQSMN